VVLKAPPFLEVPLGRVAPPFLEAACLEVRPFLEVRQGAACLVGLMQSGAARHDKL
jgi:hypothetical protein